MADKNFKVKTGLTLPSPLPVDQGGTGQTSASNTLNALLPLQTSNANKVLQTDGTNTSWITPSVAYTRGGTSSRPASPTAGDLFFNTEKKAFEVWTGSAWVSVAVNGAVPLPPTISTVTLTGSTASVPFTGSNDFGDAAITTYTATSNPGSISVNSASSPISVPGLTAATAYTFTVTATNSYGISNASSASNSVTTADVPGAPTSVTAADTGIDGEALVSWTAPGSNGGSAITDYIVEYSLNAGSSYSTFADGTSTATSATVTGLTTGTTYIFRVKTVNAVGTGTASSSTSNYIPVEHDPSAYFPISTTTLATAAASVTFSSIPSTYKHLQLRWVARGSLADNNIDMYSWLNGNTAQINYSRHALRGNSSVASSTGSAASAAPVMGNPTAANLASGIFGTGVITILDYKNTTTYKTQRAITGETENGAGNVWELSSVFKNTSAVNSIVLAPQSGNFITNSTFTLYGIKG